MTLPVPENQPYAIIVWLHNKQKYLFARKTVYTRAGGALRETFTGVGGLAPGRGWKGDSAPLP